MNIYWNIVNLALAIPGLRHSLITDPASLSLAETVSEYHQMGKIVLFNVALDVAYITGGYLMKEMAKSREKNRNILDGYGRALILQEASCWYLMRCCLRPTNEKQGPYPDIGSSTTHGYRGRYGAWFDFYLLIFQHIAQEGAFGKQEKQEKHDGPVQVNGVKISGVFVTGFFDLRFFVLVDQGEYIRECFRV